MILKYITKWKLAGFWPYTPVLGNAAETGNELSGVTGWMDAIVPGSIYADLYHANYIEDPYYEMNSLHCEWVANRWWIYRTKISIAKPTNGKRIQLVFRGIDYKSRIYFNNHLVAQQEGMYTVCRIDVTDWLQENENLIQVVLEHAPDEMGQIGYTSQTFTQKARFTYKWDFGTRLVGMGIYDDVYLEEVGASTIESSHIRYENKVISYAAEINGEFEKMQVTLSYQENKIATVCSITANATIPVENPHLWYPNGYGEQPLYTLNVQLYAKNGTLSDEKTLYTGLRTLSYEQCENCSEDALPYVVRVNGIRIYLKGINITPLDHMYGCVDKDRYDSMLRLAKDAHVTIVRVWGGGIIEKEAFYDLCDQYGIMVWQEFIQSSSGIDNIPSKRPEFLALCAKTAETAVREKRNHVSLTYWSGGNELTDKNGIPSTYEDENIARLKEIVNRLDPDRLMLPTSASGPLSFIDNSRPKENHDVHGPWKYNGVEGQYSLYNNSSSLLHSEFGNDGMSNLESLQTVLSPQNLRMDTVFNNLVWRHHGEWWDTYEYREKPIFGEIHDLPTFIKVSQYMQAEGIRYALEANRRRTWQNCGSIVWQFNEPWPNVSCTSLIDYSMNPKFAYYFYRDAFQPFHVSLRYDKLIYAEDEIFHGGVYVHDDREADAYMVQVRILNDKKEEIRTIMAQGQTELGSCVRALNFEWKISGVSSTFYIECVAKSGDRNDTNLYMLFLHPTSDAVVQFVDNFRK